MLQVQTFAAAEAQEFGGDISMLVRPSSKLQDSLGVLLHYPTYTTTLDPRNGQTRILGPHGRANSPTKVSRRLLPSGPTVMPGDRTNLLERVRMLLLDMVGAVPGCLKPQ